MNGNTAAMKPGFRWRSLWLPLLLVLIAVGIGVSDARKEKLRGDFSEFTLRASRVMMAGYDPYNRDYVGQNYKYFPTNALLVFPLTKVNVYAAQGIWFAFNLGLVVWAFSSLNAILRPMRIPWWVTAVTVAVGFRLLIMNLRLGQWNTSVFCCSIVGLRYLHQSSRLAGATLLGLAITLKYMPVVFLGYLAARRRWKDVGATCLALIFWIVLVPLLILGPSRTTELMRRYYEDSTSRVNQMVEGKKINSQSVHSAVYRKLSPVAQDNDAGTYYVNLLNLPLETGSNVAKIFSLILTAAAGVWLLRQHRRNLHINELGTLLLIGLCYLVWYMAAPGVRHAQLIGIIPIIFGIAASIALADDRKTKLKLSAGLGIISIMLTAPAEIIKDSNYNRMLEVYGILPLALIVATAVGIYAYYRVGIGSFTSSAWEVDEENRTLFGTPKY